MCGRKVCKRLQFFIIIILYFYQTADFKCFYSVRSHRKYRQTDRELKRVCMCVHLFVRLLLLKITWTLKQKRQLDIATEFRVNTRVLVFTLDR